jgi:hypothetical protein
MARIIKSPSAHPPECNVIIIPGNPHVNTVNLLFMKKGSSPNRVGGKDTRGFSAPGVCPVPGGTESAGTTRIPERLPGFRKAPVPDPLRKTESPLPSGQLHHHPTRTDGRITASLCPARDGMRPRGPSRLPPRQPTCRRREIDRIHPLDREKILKKNTLFPH